MLNASLSTDPFETNATEVLMNDATGVETKTVHEETSLRGTRTGSQIVSIIETKLHKNLI